MGQVLGIGCRDDRLFTLTGLDIPLSMPPVILLHPIPPHPLIIGILIWVMSPLVSFVL